MLVIVAPYAPADRPGTANLGAARKIEAVVEILASIDPDIVLVNSAHSEVTPAAICTKHSTIVGRDIVEITPPLARNRTIGKLRNLFDVERVLDLVESRGVPSAFWLYNGYAFEMRVAAAAHRRFKAPMILEFEDWHFSRSRGWNPKPIIDWALWRLAASQMAHSFAVNQSLASRMSAFPGGVDLLPGIVHPDISAITGFHRPFGSADKRVAIGYFGGLTVEKGAGLLLEVLPGLPKGTALHVTGSGDLSDDFGRAMARHPGRLSFHGRVDSKEMVRIMAACDVIINPHMPIVDMANGVFPFKLIESIASGRLLISTDVMTDGLEDVLGGVLFCEPEVRSLLEAVAAGQSFYQTNEAVIERCASAAVRRFGLSSVRGRVAAILAAAPSGMGGC